MTALANTTPVYDQRLAVLIVVKIMQQTGHFADAIKEWNRKPLNLKGPSPSSRIFFIAAEEERLETETTGEAGYHAANSAATNTGNQPARRRLHSAHQLLPHPRPNPIQNSTLAATANILLKATKRKPPSRTKWEAAPRW